MLNTGNRSKVIALALELSTALEKKKNKVVINDNIDIGAVEKAIDWLKSKKNERK